MLVFGISGIASMKNDWDLTAHVTIGSQQSCSALICAYFSGSIDWEMHGHLAMAKLSHDPM